MNNLNKKLHYVQSEHNPQSLKGLNTGWIPVNPCPCGCIRYPDGHKCYMEDDGCVEIAKYEGAIVYQKKLLEHIDKEIHLSVQLGHPLPSVLHMWISKMQKQLEDLNES